MAQPANTFSTYDNADNIAEAVDSLIRNLDPHETPFLDGIKSGSASNTYEEWLVDDLAAPADNKVIEGDDATTDASSKATRRGNYTQIMDKVARVTGTDEAVNTYGRTSEMNYQIMKKGKELKMDMEYALIGQNNVRVAGDDSTAREIGSIHSWLFTNTSNGGGLAAEPTGDGSDTRTDGTQRAFTEALLEGVLQSCWDESGSAASEIYVGSFNRGVFSGFTGNATQVQHGNEDKRIIATAKVYEGDFHTLTVVPSRQVRARDALVIDRNMWEVAYLRPFTTHDLAKTGDTERKQLLVEFTFKALNEKSSGGVFDLTTS
jgi:hypothetical protein